MSTLTPSATQKWFCFKKTWPLSFTQLLPYCCSRPLTPKGPALLAWQLSMNTEKSRWALTWLLGNYHQLLYHNGCSSSIFFYWLCFITLTIHSLYSRCSLLFLYSHLWSFHPVLGYKYPLCWWLRNDVYLSLNIRCEDTCLLDISLLTYSGYL